ncbi:MAG TPA: glucose-1-phosphate cytidylyltransferase [Armatimonadetes bacterium]|nr:glucose-1-phosphate cytidylyltransferase [Armatimonadota bacterium]
MKVVILCGGFGTRLREETDHRPKPMLPIGGQPILWHIMKLYAHQGFNEFVLCLGYRGEMIKDYFLNYEERTNDLTIRLGTRREITYHGQHDEQDMIVTLAETGLASMTGARVARAAPYLGDERFMVTYGDGLVDLDLRALLAFHQGHGKLATLTTVRPISRFGSLQLDEHGRVERFEEKPRLEGWINVGFLVFEPGALDYFSTDPSCVMEREPLERLAADGQLMAYRHEGFFYSMDTYREYVHFNELWDSGAAPWKIW